MKCLRPLVLSFFIAPVLLAAGRSRAVKPIPPPAVTSGWTAPQCNGVSGFEGVYFTRDEGRTIINVDSPPPINALVLLTLTDIPNRLYATFRGSLYESRDSGCRWVSRGRVPLELTGIVSAPGGRAYAWSYYDQQLVRITPMTNDVVVLPESILGLGIDPRDSQHLIAVSRRATYESNDDGSTWRINGPAGAGLINAVAFDPRDVRRIAVGYSGGASITRDGGSTWQRSDSAANVWSLAFSPADSNVIWMQGLTGGTERIFRSSDGGVTFREVLSASTIHFNRAPLFPHPNDSERIALRAWQGLAFVDARDGSVRLGPFREWDQVTWSPVPEVIYLTAHSTVIIN